MDSYSFTDKKELISVIIPIFNGDKYVENIINKIMRQTYSSWELILVDDGSVDQTKEICMRYEKVDRRIHLISKKNEGVSKARDTGIAHSKGIYIAFIDVDDDIEVDYLSHLYARSKETNADIVCCDAIEYVLEENKYVPYPKYHQVKQDRIICDKLDVFRDYFKGNEQYYTTVWGKLIRKECLENIRFPNMKYSEDTWVVLNLAMNDTKFCLTTYQGYHYFRWQESTTMRYGKINVQNNIDNTRLADQIDNWCKELDDLELISKAYTNLSNQLFQCIRAMRIVNDYKNFATQSLFLREIMKIKNIKSTDLKQYVVLSIFKTWPLLCWNITRFFW